MQLQRKHETLARALARYPGLRRTRPLPCVRSPLRAGYRNRAKMAVGMSSRGLRLGYFRAGTREIVDAPDCRVLVPALLQTTRRIRRFLETSRDIPPELRHIDVRCGSDPTRQHLILVFRATDCPVFPVDRLRKCCSNVKGISVNLNPRTDGQVIRGSVRPLWGEREVWVDHANCRLRVSPAAFFQVNLALLPTIHALMESFFGRGDVLADLYAGVGTHGPRAASAIPACAVLRRQSQRSGRLEVDDSPDRDHRLRHCSCGGRARTRPIAGRGTRRRRAESVPRRRARRGPGRGGAMSGDETRLPLVRPDDIVPRPRHPVPEGLHHPIGAAHRHDAANSTGRGSGPADPTAGRRQGPHLLVVSPDHVETGGFDFRPSSGK